MKPEKIAVVPKVHGLGGMVSFQGRFINGLENRGFQVIRDMQDTDVGSILIIGGTRKVGSLLAARMRGVRLVQRLNGMNWLHKVQPTPLHQFLRAEMNNWLLAFIRRFLAHHIIYQSQFSKWWWEKKFGKLSKPDSVVYNAVDLQTYSPSPALQIPHDRIRILIMEGHMGDFYSSGLTSAFDMASKLAELSGEMVELVIAGDVPADLQQKMPFDKNIRTTFLGVISAAEVPSLTQSVHMLFSADLNAACPNSVVEALACGLPVLAFDTGALREMIPVNAGLVVPYGSDYWKLEKPDIAALAQAALKIKRENSLFRAEARDTAVKMFDIENMLDGYLNALGK